MKQKEIIDAKIDLAKKMVQKFLDNENDFLPFALAYKKNINDIEYIVDDFGEKDISNIVYNYEQFAKYLFEKEEATSYLLVINGISDQSQYDGVIVMKLTYNGTDWHTANFYYKKKIILSVLGNA